MPNSAVGRLLVACVTGDAWSLPSDAVRRHAAGVDAAATALGAEYHGVPGYVRAALMAADVRPDVVEAVLQPYHRGLLHHLRALSDLTVVDAALGAVDAPYAVVKGPVVATRAHQRPDLRAYSDLDVVVPPPHFGPAVRSLLAAGAIPVTRAFHALVDVEAGELTLSMPSGGTLDLHWHTINSAAVRRAFDVRPADLVARASVVDVGGVLVPVLDAADEVVYVAMHAVLSGAHRLLWIKDVERLVANRDLAWDVVAERARAARAELVVAVALRHASAVLGTQLPRDARRRFAISSLWPWAAQAVSRFARIEDAVGDTWLPSRLGARSTRYGFGSSMAELARRARASSAPRGLTPNARPPDPDSVEALGAFTAWVDARCGT